MKIRRNRHYRYSRVTRIYIPVYCFRVRESAAVLIVLLRFSAILKLLRLVSGAIFLVLKADFKEVL